ncbi:PHP domain-containing protein [Chloroflexota bacterium]
MAAILRGHPELLKADFHVHTRYSKDCDTSLEEIINRCLKTEITCIAISDHGTIEGAREMQSLAPFRVIVAEEILTPDGEVMGMFLKEGIPSGISIEEVISRIREQDALVAIPHPFDPLRGIRLSNNRLSELAGQIDIIEAFNARSPFIKPARKARDFALKHDLPMTAGSDAHSAGEIGLTYVEMPEFNDKDGFLRALREGRIIRHRTSPLVHFRTTLVKIKKLF